MPQTHWQLFKYVIIIKYSKLELVHVIELEFLYNLLNFANKFIFVFNNFQSHQCLRRISRTMQNIIEIFFLFFSHHESKIHSPVKCQIQK